MALSRQAWTQASWRFFPHIPQICLRLVAYPLRLPSWIWHLFHKEGSLDISPASELISDLNGNSLRLDRDWVTTLAFSSWAATRHTQKGALLETCFVDTTHSRVSSLKFRWARECLSPALRERLQWLHVYFFTTQETQATWSSASLTLPALSLCFCAAPSLPGALSSL